jgi:hypothetical protein
MSQKPKVTGEWRMSALLLLALTLSGSPNVTAQAAVPAQAVEGKYKGLSAAEADTLIAKLHNAQARLRAGDKLTFELLAGAPVLYPESETPPREAFLAMAFDRPWSVERRPDMGLWQSYELIYFPPGQHSLMWKVDVFAQGDALERVEMLYTAPPPF